MKILNQIKYLYYIYIMDKTQKMIIYFENLEDSIKGVKDYLEIYQTLFIILKLI